VLSNHLAAHATSPRSVRAVREPASSRRAETDGDGSARAPGLQTPFRRGGGARERGAPPVYFTTAPLRRTIAYTVSNALYYGDNLAVLRRHLQDASVDLVYLDPPFQSGRDYSLSFESRAHDSDPEGAAPRAFTDTWRWGHEAEGSYAEVARAGGRVATTMQALRAILGESDIMAYLCMMAPRLVELRRVLKASGSLYLHCDPTASHYLKVLLDGIFGPACFRNEVIWRYRRWPAKARRFQRMHDVLLFYTASRERAHTFNTLYGYEKLAESTLKTFGTRKQRADFSSGHRKPGLEAGETQGPPLSDFWDLDGPDGRGPPLSDAWEIGVIAAIGRERTGYPTQKPETLLERIIRSSSNEGDLVLDPFCGCGTAIAVAERLRRRWAGIDVTHLALNLVRERMKTAAFEVHGEPIDLPGVRQLAADDPLQFQWWILGRVGARPVARTKGADSGVDGELVFSSSHAPSGGRVAIAVSAGRHGSARVRELRALLSRDEASIGVLLTLEEPTAAMRAEAARAGLYESTTGRHPRIQILTAEAILRGRRVDHPGAMTAAAGAPRHGPPDHEPMSFPAIASTRPPARTEGASKAGHVRG
jgi:site-specific DNA-methyltransferase (adenine-specific)